MTRFLSRALADLDARSVNEETERLFAYHHATKHSYHSVRATAHFLDWRNQPNPFRIYDGVPVVALQPRLNFSQVGTFATIAALAEAGTGGKGDGGGKGSEAGAGENQKTAPHAVRLDASWLSRLLWHSMATSAWKQVPRMNYRYSLRVNPSSGNLHPTETHLALRSVTGLDDGLYHYRADIHALEQRGRGEWATPVARALELLWAAEAPLIVALTSVFWREAWKYRDRAYRYCCHDLGHALMSLLLAAHALGLPGGAVAQFSDPRLAHTLGLAQSDEAPMAFLVFQTPPGAFPRTVPTREPQVEQEPETLGGMPNQLSEEEVPYYLLLGMHRSTVLPGPAGPLHVLKKGCGPGVVSPQALAEPRRDAPLGVVVRRRRSALDFDPTAPPMERADLEQLLDFATRDWLADWRGNLSNAAVRGSGGRDFVTLYLHVHRIRGLEPGVYRWHTAEHRLEQLHRGNVERVAAYLSLEQQLAGNACFAISMIADLEAAAHLFGNRGYRYVHFEAGAIGQRLYVGAEALGWNSTGIGAFYDDEVHRYLGFLEEGKTPVAASAYAAEQAALVMLGSPASRAARSTRGRDADSTPVISESGEESVAASAARPEPAENQGTPRDPRSLPRQVIYHFAVGRAVPDPRLAAPEQ